MVSSGSRSKNVTRPVDVLWGKSKINKIFKKKKRKKILHLFDLMDSWSLFFSRYKK
jgi:hypothetical protein